MGAKRQNKDKRKQGKPLKTQAIRNREYHRQMELGDWLYERSREGKPFYDLMGHITSEENILMAVRNLRGNRGGDTPGIDGVTHSQIAAMDERELIGKIRGRLESFTPLPGKRVYIPKPGSEEGRPITMLAAEDKIVDQSILQVLEPIAEAKFHKDSSAFRPDRGVENAVQRFCQLANLVHLHYVVSVDIRGFFDNVDHNKLRKQLWTMGIRDKRLLSIIAAELKRPVVMPDGSVVTPERGVPQGGVLSPLLANIVLNELDWWISGQWETFPVPEGIGRNDPTKYRSLRAKTKLKPMFIVRYADDFKIFTDTKENAERILAAVTMWLKERLGLGVSPEKTAVTNLRKRSVDFLGFRFKLRRKGGKWVVFSHMTPKAVRGATEMLKRQVIRVQRAPNRAGQVAETHRYNAMVMGLHEYYSIATDISHDMARINKSLRYVWHNRVLKHLKDPRKGEMDPDSAVCKRYGESKQVRYLNGVPIAPVAFCGTRAPMSKNKNLSRYTPKGRERIHRNLKFPLTELFKLMKRTAGEGRTVEFINNRISRFCGQYGKCAVTGVALEADSMHCHHVVPKHIRGPDDSYENLRLVTNEVHILIHATRQDTIMRHLHLIKEESQLKTLNKLRISAGNFPLIYDLNGGMQLSFFDLF